MELEQNKQNKVKKNMDQDHRAFIAEYMITAKDKGDNNT